MGRLSQPWSESQHTDFYFKHNNKVLCVPSAELLASEYDFHGPTVCQTLAYYLCVSLFLTNNTHLKHSYFLRWKEMSSYCIIYALLS